MIKLKSMMSDKFPLVSIIIPCYNAEMYIRETLDCVSRISYKNWECIIINDGSTDRSQVIIQEYCNKDQRFHGLIQEQMGPSVARNNGIKNSNGKYIFPLDADDLISDTYIEEAVDILENNLNVKIVYAKAKMFGRKNCDWNLPEYSFDKLLLENMIFVSAMFRKDDFLKTNGFDPTFREGREDWDFWIELLKTGGEVHKIDKVHFFYRTHKFSHNKNAAMHIKMIRKKIYQKHKELYDGIIDNPIQLIHEHAFYKKKYNLLRILTFRKPI